MICTFFWTLTICFLIFSQNCFASGVNGSFRLDEYNFVPLLYKGEETGYQACTIKGSAYVPVEALEEFGDCSAFTLDGEAHRAVFTPADMNVLLGDDETTDFIKRYAGSCYLGYKTIYGKDYISLNVMKDFTGITYTTDGTSGLSNDDVTDITYVDLDRLTETHRMGQTVRNTIGAGSLFSSSEEEVPIKSGRQVYILGESASFYKIRTTGGQVCYVNKEDIEETDDHAPEYDYSFMPLQKEPYDRKINLVWTSPNSAGVSSLAPDPTGIDVVSPVWLNQIVEGDGNINSFVDRGYSDLCHERGMKVWITLNNDMTTTGSTNYTTKVLEDDGLRRKTVAQYLFYAMIGGADGLCIDYEDVRSSDGPALALFTEELAYYCGRLGLYITSAVYSPMPGNEQIYQYARIGECLDYICVMSYDYHYNGSPDAGSVSPIPFYREMIEKMSGYCEPEKLIMGIPFYTRIWKVGENDRNLGALAVIMSTARDRVTKNNAQIEWSDEDGQYIALWQENGDNYKCWLEDERSIAQKIRCIYEYGLSGSCCWRYGQQENGIMDMFEDVYHQDGSWEDHETDY